MTTDDTEEPSERDRTDESLRVEREKVDETLRDRLATIDETADEVISKARERADEVLATARARTDEKLATSVASPAVERERDREDSVLRKERSREDETIREERADQAEMLSTEREGTDKDLHHERAQSDSALATRDEFLEIVSHDLRDMVTSVVGYAWLVEKDLTLPNHVEAVATHARGIRRLSVRMNRLIGDLIDVASIEAGTLAVTCDRGDPAHVVTEAVDAFSARASGRGITLDADIVPPFRPAFFDSARVLQVLSNLLSNAIKFTLPKGRVVVRVEQDEHFTHFSVSDTGVGIPAGPLERVFERSFQVKKNDAQGMGLGLYISKCIVLGHGGKIWAESKEGHGSTFHVALPIQDSASEPPSSKTSRDDS